MCMCMCVFVCVCVYVLALCCVVSLWLCMCVVDIYTFSQSPLCIHRLCIFLVNRSIHPLQVDPSPNLLLLAIRRTSPSQINPSQAKPIHLMNKRELPEGNEIAGRSMCLFGVRFQINKKAKQIQKTPIRACPETLDEIKIEDKMYNVRVYVALK